MNEVMSKVIETVRETEEEFIFTSISSFCEEITERKISKKELTEALFNSRNEVCSHVGDIAECDQWICSECGIHIEDWHRIEVDEDDGDIYHYQYEFRFCPNCGRRIK